MQIHGTCFISGKSLTLHSFSQLTSRDRVSITKAVGKFTEFKLPLKSMPVGTQEFDYHLDKQFFVNMESTDIHGADLDVNLTVVHKADVYELHFHVTGTVTLLCDRCLDAMLHDVDTTYDISVKYGEAYCDDSDTLLEIPESENYLNVAYMLYDTVALTIPIKHVHAPGQCNKDMSAMLHRHKVRSTDDSALEETLIEEMDSMTDDSDPAPSDPRWDALKGLASGSDDE